MSQTAAPARFEVADTHASPRSIDLHIQAVYRQGGRYELQNATMLDLIRTAYSVDADNVVGGPDWLEYDRFDVIAKVPSNTPANSLSAMLQSLLADRFGLIVHNDMKQVSRVVLARSNGMPKMKPTASPDKTGCQTQPGVFHVTRDGPFVDPSTMSCHNVTMETFASLLQGVASGYLSTPVIDVTGIKGSWDFDLKWMPKSALSAAGAGDATIFEAVDKQLGLKLEEQQVTSSVLVVDSVHQKPTDNPTDLGVRLPALPTEFEVTDVKPVLPGAPRSGGPLRFSPSGHISLPSIPLRYTILLAWRLSSSEQLANAPKWLTATQPEIDLNVEVPTSLVPENGRPLPIKDLAPMLQNMLKDRFKMNSHFEDQMVTAYTLVSIRPKLKKAESGRTKCKQEDVPVTGRRGPGAISNSRVTCRNVSMAQFADQLQAISVFAEAPRLAFPVLDGTHLNGAWDLTFTFNPAPPRPALIVTPTTTNGLPGAASASDPADGDSLFEALEKQLGLRLEPQRRSYPVLVIDHLEERPTEN